MLRYAVSKQRYQNAIATDAFSDLAVVQFRLLGFLVSPTAQRPVRGSAGCLYSTACSLACSCVNWRWRAVAPYVDVVMMGHPLPFNCSQWRCWLGPLFMIAVGGPHFSKETHEEKKEGLLILIVTPPSAAQEMKQHTTRASNRYGINPVPNSAATGRAT